MTKECKGGCGKPALYGEWCEIKGKRYVACPVIIIKRAKAISEYRIKEGKEGKNPMQNPRICKKNHSPERNKKAAKALKRLGQLGLLPQQIESEKLKEKRRKNIKKTLRKLWLQGKHPIQLESSIERKKRFKRISQTLKKLGSLGKLPTQNMSKEKKEKIARKISKKLREGIRTGRIKLSKSWKKVPYKNLILRSEWEKIVAKCLDKNKVRWKYEHFVIPYWDTQRRIKANTIPDFYLPKYNTIIEVKSNAEYKTKRTLDKIKGIENKGYEVLLFGRKEIEILKNDKRNLIKLIHQNEKSKS
ncbi:MAG: hypothetical protein ACKKMV_02930 [Candidatus Nealsonbacteria bacterium]